MSRVTACHDLCHDLKIRKPPVFIGLSRRHDLSTPRGTPLAPRRLVAPKSDEGGSQTKAGPGSKFQVQSSKFNVRCSMFSQLSTPQLSTPPVRLLRLGTAGGTGRKSESPMFTGLGTAVRLFTPEPTPCLRRAAVSHQAKSR